MINKLLKSLVFFTFLIIISINVFGLSLANNTLYWALDVNNATNQTDSSGNGYYGNVTNAVFNASGKLGSAYIFDGTQDYIQTANNTQIGNLSNFNFTISMWVYSTSASSNILIEKTDASAGGYGGWYMSLNGNGSLAFAPHNPSCNAGLIALKPVGKVNLSVWTHVAVVRNGNDFYGYINGTKYTLGSGSGAICEKMQPVKVGAYWDGTAGIIGKIDEVLISRRAYSDSEIAELINNQNGFNPYNLTVNNLTLNSLNFYNNSNINNFSVIIRNSTTNLSYNTTTGSITTDISSLSSSLYNITYSSNNYFNNTYNNVNASNTHIGYLYQSIINFSLKEFDNNISLNNFSLNISGKGIVCNTTIESSCLIYPNGNQSYNYSLIDNSGNNFYTPINNTFDVLFLDNKTILSYVYEHTINVTAKNVLNNVSITNFTINITDNTDGSDNRVLSTTNGTLIIPVIHHNYTLTIDGLGYALYNNTKNFNITDNVNTTFYLYTTNSINLSFFDSVTLSPILQNVTVNFLGAISQTNVTSTGSLYVDLFTPSEYTIKSSSDTYRTNTYVLTLSNKTFNYIPIYLEKTNSSYLVLMTIKDKFSKDQISNAKITIQKYNNNAWVTDQIYNTDFNGQSEGYFILSTQYYNFVVEYNGVTYFGTLNSNPNKKIIYSEDVTNGITIEIDLNPTTTILNYNNIYNNVYTSIDYQNVTNVSGYFIFRWTDIDGIPRNASLDVYQANTLNCSSTGYSASGSINCLVINNGTLKLFSGIGKIDDTPRNAINKLIGYDNSYNFDWGIGGWIIALFIVIIGYTAFAQIPSLSLWFGTGIFCLTIFLGLIFKNIDLSIFGLILFVAFILGKIRSESGVNS